MQFEVRICQKIYNKITKTENFYYEMRWKFTIATTTVALVTIIIAVATAITTHFTHMIFRHFDYWLKLCLQVKTDEKLTETAAFILASFIRRRKDSLYFLVKKYIVIFPV